MNDKGVISGMSARYCQPMSEQGIPAGVIIRRCLQSASNAGEMAAQIQTVIHTEGKNRAGSAFSCADYRELYVVEGYRKVSEIYGPLKGTVFAYGNYALTDGKHLNCRPCVKVNTWKGGLPSWPRTNKRMRLVSC